MRVARLNADVVPLEARAHFISALVNPPYSLPYKIAQNINVLCSVLLRSTQHPPRGQAANHVLNGERNRLDIQLLDLPVPDGIAKDLLKTLREF